MNNQISLWILSIIWSVFIFRRKVLLSNLSMHLLFQWSCPLLHLPGIIFFYSTGWSVSWGMGSSSLFKMVVLATPFTICSSITSLSTAFYGVICISLITKVSVSDIFRRALSIGSFPLTLTFSFVRQMIFSTISASRLFTISIFDILARTFSKVGFFLLTC